MRTPDRKYILTFLTAVVAVVAVSGGCASEQTQTTHDTPTEAYKRLYAAVKNKDTEAIKKQMTEKTISLAEMSAQRFDRAPEQAFENGLTGTTFSETLPEIRDERVEGNMGAVEVWNAKAGKWEDLPFILENGMWKLAVGEAFAGTFKSPGWGRDRREKEAANAVSNSRIVIGGNNANLAGNKANGSK